VKAFASDRYTVPLPPTHSFPMAKYEMLRRQVIQDESVAVHDLLEPPPATDSELRLAHHADYVERVVCGTLTEPEVRELGLPWSESLVERSRRSVGGTIQAARWALRDGLAVNLAGGTHHAAAGKGAGYCVFNDVAVAIRLLQAEGAIARALVIDCDVHQGDGTAQIFANDPSVFTFSIHGARNYPLRKPESDIDIPLDDGTGDEAYLEALKCGLAAALDRSRADMAFYLAGADPYADDRLGRLALSKAGLAARDRMVFGACLDRRLPVAVSMAGGYARQIADTVLIQAETVRLASLFANRWPQAQDISQMNS